MNFNFLTFLTRHYLFHSFVAETVFLYRVQNGQSKKKRNLQESDGGYTMTLEV